MPIQIKCEAVKGLLKKTIAGMVLAVGVVALPAQAQGKQAQKKQPQQPKCPPGVVCYQQVKPEPQPYHKVQVIAKLYEGDARAKLFTDALEVAFKETPDARVGHHLNLQNAWIINVELLDGDENAPQGWVELLYEGTDGSRKLHHRWDVKIAPRNEEAAAEKIYDEMVEIMGNHPENMITPEGPRKATPIPGAQTPK
jgi:hypothetical protein